MKPASAPPAFWETLSSTSPADWVLNTGSITGCMSPRTPARGAASSQRSRAWCNGSSRSQSDAVSSRYSDIATLNGTFFSLSAIPLALGNP